MFDLLDQAVDEHDQMLSETIQDPHFDEARSFPRSQMLLKKVGLPVVSFR
jgi:hypothetical protein